MMPSMRHRHGCDFTATCARGRSNQAASGSSERTVTVTPWRRVPLTETGPNWWDGIPGFSSRSPVAEVLEGERGIAICVAPFCGLGIVMSYHHTSYLSM